MLSKTAILFQVISAFLIGVRGLLKVGVIDEQNTFLRLVNGQCSDSFECGIIEHICKELKEKCEIVELPDFESRISYLQEQKVNFTLSKLSVSENRENKIEFVRPYYYYAGAVILHLNSTPESQQYGWKDIENVTLCSQVDYYAAPIIKFLYKPNINVTEKTLLQAIQDGDCDAAIKDNTDILNGLIRSSKTQPEFGAPYAIAVNKNDAATLGKEISKVLISIMNNGNDSLIFEFENRYLNESSSLRGSERLREVVAAITENKGPIPYMLEDAIWRKNKLQGDITVCNSF